VGFGLAAGDGISVTGNDITLDSSFTGLGSTADSFLTVTNSANTGATYTCVTDALEGS